MQDSRGADPLIGEDVKEAAQKRVFGFEIMSAPFVIAHWQVGNLLAGLKAPLDPTKSERPAVYLTNALTGWEPPDGAKATLPMFPELETERDQAENVKQNVPILVVLGNPPYNAYAGTSPDEENDLVEPYKEGLISDWKIKKFNLDELYVRFFRIAERRIAETGRGIISYISNYSYTTEPSFVVMRQHLLQSFDKFWIENMHGDRNKTEYAPDGRTSETIFAIPGFSSGIRQGVAIGLAVKTGKPDEPTVVRYRDDIDEAKAKDRRQQLLDSISVSPFDDQYQIADPQHWNKLSFRPKAVDPNYLSWPLLNELPAIAPINGLMEKRGGALIDIDKAALTSRMQTYFDPTVDWAGLNLTKHPLVNAASGYNPKNARSKAVLGESFEQNKIVRYITRPFDVRYAYVTDASTLWNRSRPDLCAQFSSGNRFLMSRPSGVADPEGAPIIFTRCLGDNDAQRGHSYYLPFENITPGKGMLPASKSANLSSKARAYLSHLGLPNPDTDAKAQEAIWHHALAIGFSPKYLSDNADGLTIDWLRIPLPDDAQVLANSADLGAQVAALLDTESDVIGVTSGSVNDHLKAIGIISANDLRIAAGWGSKDSKNRVNPGRGKTELREWTKVEISAMTPGLSAIGLSNADAFALLGKAVDVYLNDDTFWRGVPEAVWNYHIGGYQVLKKWLSYREEAFLERHLTKDEAREVTNMTRRIAALILLSGKLDHNYAHVQAKTYSW